MGRTDGKDDGASAIRAARRGQATQARCSHTSDAFLQDFLDPSLDAAAFFNAKLPPLALRQQEAGHGLPLADLSTQTQTLLSQLSAHTTRLSDALTQATDDMMRSGGRLAYEVELLRGEALSFSDAMHDTLPDDIKVFLPEGLPQRAAEAGAAGDVGDGEKAACIQQLQTLTLVRSRLESVIRVFGDAMEFPFPPSELSVGSSFLSVSAPDPESQQQSLEERGQEVLRKLRGEITALLSHGDDPVGAVERAAERIEDLKTLASVWKGTAEEKGRNRAIEGLAKMVEDRHRELLAELGRTARKSSRLGDAVAAERTGPPGDAIADGAKAPAAEPAVAGAGAGGFGLISQLQKLRGGL